MKEYRLLRRPLYEDRQGRPFYGNPSGIPARPLLAPGEVISRDELRGYFSDAEIDQISEPAEARARYYIGVDFGRQADHSAAVVVRRRGEWDSHRLEVIGIQRWPLQTPYETVISEVLGKYAKSPPDSLLVVDSTGVGDGLWEMMQLRLGDGRPVIGAQITSGGSATLQPDGSWHLGKSLLVTQMAVRVQNGELSIPRNLPLSDVLEREIKSYRSKITRAAHVIFEAWREQDHDDVVFATMLTAWAAGCPQLEPLPPITCRPMKVYGAVPGTMINAGGGRF